MSLFFVNFFEAAVSLFFLDFFGTAVSSDFIGGTVSLSGSTGRSGGGAGATVRLSFSVTVLLDFFEAAVSLIFLDFGGGGLMSSLLSSSP